MRISLTINRTAISFFNYLIHCSVYEMSGSCDKFPLTGSQNQSFQLSAQNPKAIQLTVLGNSEKQQILTFEQLGPMNVRTSSLISDCLS